MGEPLEDISELSCAGLWRVWGPLRRRVPHEEGCILGFRGPHGPWFAGMTLLGRQAPALLAGFFNLSIIYHLSIYVIYLSINLSSIYISIIYVSSITYHLSSITYLSSVYHLSVISRLSSIKYHLSIIYQISIIYLSSMYHLSPINHLSSIIYHLLPIIY